MDRTENKAFTGQILTFDPMPPQRDGEGAELRTGVFYGPDGSATLRVFAPNAGEVGVRLDNRELLPMERGGDGVWQADVAFDGSRTGPRFVDVLVDGAPFLCPWLPVCWNGDRPVNCIEIPDPALDFCLLRDVPHGVLHRELVYSPVMEGWERVYVYTPPGYGRDGECLPVLYLLHGTGDNETSWDQTGKAQYILDNLIADGEASPFVVVMCNGMLRTGGVIRRQLDLSFETMLIEDVMPMVERSYMVKTGKWDRAIAGLSMGAYTTNDIFWHHPELFGWVGQFTAGMVREPAWTDYERPFAAALKNLTPEDFGGLVKLFFRSTTPLEDHFEFFLADDAIYSFYGLDSLPCYRRVVYPESTSKWNSWRMGLRDFSKLLFKDCARRGEDGNG